MEDFEVFAENVKNQILEFLPEEYQSASAEMKQVSGGWASASRRKAGKSHRSCT